MILKMTDMTGKLSKWRLQLSESDCKVVSRGGVRPQVVEALLHLPTTRIEEFTLEDDVPVFTIAEVQSKEEKTKKDEKFCVVSLVMMEWTP